MKERLKNFFGNPLSLLLSFVVILVLFGITIWVVSSPRVQTFLGDKKTVVTTTPTTTDGNLVIPILSLPGGTPARLEEAVQVTTSYGETGQIASGISVVRPPQSLPHAQIATEIRDNRDHLTLEALEQQIRLSSNVVSVGRITMRGKAAIAYVTSSAYAHNIAYIDGAQVIYYASKEFIPAQ